MPEAAAKKKDAFGLRIGSGRSKAAALYARPSGATLEEVKEALGTGHYHFNILTILQRKGHHVDERKEAGPENRVITRYFLTLKSN